MDSKEGGSFTVGKKCGLIYGREGDVEGLIYGLGRGVSVKQPLWLSLNHQKN